MSNISAVDVPSLKSLQHQAKDPFAVGRLAETMYFFRQGLALSEGALGRGHGDTLEYRNDLARACRAAGPMLVRQAPIPVPAKRCTRAAASCCAWGR